ncbi:MAG: FlgD immunoglobulin-like domain containing protein [Candidatus Hodarchaeota archaeon]
MYGNRVGSIYGATKADYFVIDRSGILVYRGHGYNTNEVETAIKQALNTTDIKNDDLTNPLQFSLKQNYPNPFNPQTTISFQLNNTSPLQVRLLIYDLLGKNIRTLVNNKLSVGSYQIKWDGLNSNGKQVISGIYYYELQVGDQKLVRKMSLVR